jgi:hypothetical protein
VFSIFLVTTWDLASMLLLEPQEHPRFLQENRPLVMNTAKTNLNALASVTNALISSGLLA